MPLTYGGGSSSIEQIRRVLAIGIEKVVIGAGAADDKLLSSAAAVFGSQSIVAAVDVRKTALGRREVWTHSGNHNLRVDARAYCLQMQEFGAGELFVQSIDLEGTRAGYDITLMKGVPRCRFR